MGHDRFDIIFTSLENYRRDVDNRQFLETVEQCNTIRSEFEYIKDFIFDYSVPDSIGYTRA
jgi:hypothetical protein